MERIGVLGGTFNPVHNGHIHLARWFIKSLSLDRVLLVPVKSPPHKGDVELVSAQQRLEMCRLAVAPELKLDVSDIEITRGGVSYTVDTLKALSRQYKDTRLYFLTGADMFLTLEKWHDFSQIPNLAALCATARHADELDALCSYAKYLELQYGAECHIENMPVLEVSSTQIRSLLASGNDASSMLPPKVYEYILANNLYRTIMTIPF
jgi:nicotinate-nucleotide adenylyltransferase